MQSRNHFSDLDILRGFASLSVVIYHIIEIYPWPDFMSGSNIGLWFHIGWMGVDLFFVISGFVIALSAFSLMECFPDGFRWQFMKRRFARIVPLHYLTCLIFAVFCIPSIFFEPTALLHAVAHAAFAHNLHPITHGSINGANWSLGTEMQFYLLVALTAPLLRRVNPLWILAGGIGIAWAWRALCFWYLHIHLGNQDTFRMFFATTQLPGMLDEFALGIFFARLLSDDVTGHLRSRMSSLRLVWPVLATVAIATSLHIFWQIPDYWVDWRQVIFWRTSLGLSCLLILISACFLLTGHVHRLMAPFRYLGTISYGLYLWHLPIILAFKTIPLGDPARFSHYVIPTVLLFAAGSWHFFEKPLLERYAK